MAEKSFYHAASGMDAPDSVPLQFGNKNYIVTSGLKPGDKIVVEGVQTLKDGHTGGPGCPAQDGTVWGIRFHALYHH